MKLKTANALIELGVKDGDRVAIYLPMIPEAAIAILPAQELVRRIQLSLVGSLQMHCYLESKMLMQRL